MVEMKVDLRKFESALVQFQVQTSLAWRDVIRMQAKAMVTRLIQWTFPNGLGKSAQKAGQAKIEGDVRRVFTDFGNFEFRDLSIQRAWETQDKATLEKIFRESPSLNSFTLLEKPDPAVHQEARRRGRVPKRNVARHIIMGGRRRTGGQELTKYVKDVQKRAGKAKAGWLPGARHLSAKFPAWLSKTGGANLGDVQDKTDAPLDPQLTLVNLVDYISNIFPDSRVQQVVNSRVRDMQKNAETYVRAKARKAGFDAS